MLRYNTAGFIMLVTVLTCGVGELVVWVAGIVEGLIYLTKKPVDAIYLRRSKEWF